MVMKELLRNIQPARHCKPLCRRHSLACCLGWLIAPTEPNYLSRRLWFSGDLETAFTYQPTSQKAPHRDRSLFLP